MTLWTVSPPGSSVHGILQARMLEWEIIPFSRDIPNPGIKPWSPALQAYSLPSEPPGSFQMWAGNGAGKERMMACPGVF